LVPQVATAEVAHWVVGIGAVPDGTLVQVPALPLSAHDMQVPVQALLQQTPCWQKPEPHSEALEQGFPGVFSVQAPELQTLGETQSASAVHEVLQTVALPQVRFPGQAPAVTGLQVPAPSQVCAGVSVETLQAAATHCVPLG
jgi:hypothetical protein